MNMHSRQTQYSQPQQEGQRPASLLNRVLPYATLLTSVTGVATILIVGANFILPEAYGPSAWIGRFHGNMEKTDIVTKGDEVIKFTREQTRSTFEPQGWTQMETDAFRTQQQTTADSLAMQSFMANAADLGCMLGALVPPDASPDARQVGSALRKACGVSDQIRQNQIETLKRSGQQGSTILARPNPSSR